MENKEVSETSLSEKAWSLIEANSASFTGMKIHSYTMTRALHESEQTISSKVEKLIAFWSL